MNPESIAWLIKAALAIPAPTVLGHLALSSADASRWDGARTYRYPTAKMATRPYRSLFCSCILVVKNHKTGIVAETKSVKTLQTLTATDTFHIVCMDAQWNFAVALYAISYWRQLAWIGRHWIKGKTRNAMPYAPMKTSENQLTNCTFLETSPPTMRRWKRRMDNLMAVVATW
jgi:hypothetical protein